MIAGIEITGSSLALAMAGAFFLGVSKSGFPGLALVNVLIMAELFGARESVGIILPLLIACDLIVYPLFRKFASWREVWPLLPPTLIGLIAGTFLLARIDNDTARKLIGAIVLTMLTLQLLREYHRHFLENLPDSKTFLFISGSTIGVSTMIANAAGPVYSIWALVHRLAKGDFLGIGARFFLMVNLIKAPILAFGIPGVGSLALITAESLKLDLILLPGIFGGILLGRKLLNIVPQRLFEIFLYLFSLIAGIRMLIG